MEDWIKEVSEFYEKANDDLDIRKKEYRLHHIMKEVLWWGFVLLFFFTFAYFMIELGWRK